MRVLGRGRDFLHYICSRPTGGGVFGDAAIGAGYGSDGQFGLRFSAPYGDGDVHAFDGADFGDEFAGARAESFAAHPLFEHSPHCQREEPSGARQPATKEQPEGGGGTPQQPDEDVRFDSLGFLVVDRAQFEAAFGGAECGLGLRELDIPTPQFGGVGFEATERSEP